MSSFQTVLTEERRKLLEFLLVYIADGRRLTRAEFTEDGTKQLHRAMFALGKEYASDSKYDASVRVDDYTFDLMFFPIGPGLRDEPGAKDGFQEGLDSVGRD
jgi:hypothetical protein